MMTNDDGGGEGGKKCRKNDDVICERPLSMFSIFHLAAILTDSIAYSPV